MASSSVHHFPLAPTMASSLPIISLCFLFLLAHGSVAQKGSEQESQQRRSSRCRLDRLSTLQPSRRVQSEAGFTEYFDDNNQQLECAGVAAYRRTIEPQGLLVPSYSSAPRLVYIIQGTATCGVVLPGCPETYQSLEQKSDDDSRDQHQRVQRLRQGDIFALPAGVSYWCHNDGDSPVVSVSVIDTSNSANQLDTNQRTFLLAGSQSSQKEQSSSGDNIFSGFDVDLLADALGVRREIAQKLQKARHQGEIVRVQKGFQMVRPPMTTREEQQQVNGLEQNLCNMQLRENIDSPWRADYYSPQGGRVTSLNAQKLPILRFIQLSAIRGVLRKGAILSPHWNINVHTLVYATSGRARVQIVGDNGRAAFDGELREGQMLFVPQNFAVMSQAKSERFEWVAFKTGGNPMSSHIAGQGSLFRGLPNDVIANSYSGLSREEARELKLGRGEQVGILPPRSQQGKADA